MGNIFNLLGPIVLGIMVGGIILFLKRVLKLPLPGWLIPIGAAAAMFAYHISSDYSWYEATTAQLPEEIVVVESYTSKNTMQPWTYVVPRISRFMAIDKASLRTNPSLESLVIVDVLLVQRYSPTVTVVQLIDCEGGKSADLSAQQAFDANGMPQDVQWRELGGDHPLVAQSCALAKDKG